MTELEKYSLKLNKANSKIRILEDMVEARTRELFIFNAELEDRVARRTAELKKIIYELEQLTYIVSHDLKSPLSNISGLVTILRMNLGSDLDESNKEMLQLIQNSTARMTSLVEEILEHSLVGTQKNIDSVDCNELLKELQDDLHKTLSDHNVKIEFKSLPTLNAYKTELRQLFQNLISNAIKFSKENHDPRIEIMASLKENLWHFSVKDNGIGIDPKHQEKIFGTFERGFSDDKFEGHGIGLSTCKKIVQLHHGDIWVNSVLGEGSVFYFTLADDLDQMEMGNSA